VTAKNGTISLKAESVAERDQWIQAIKGLIGGFDRTQSNSAGFVLEIEDSIIENSQRGGGNVS
jgi:hypothetical protein